MTNIEQNAGGGLEQFNQKAVKNGIIATTDVQQKT